MASLGACAALQGFVDAAPNADYAALSFKYIFSRKAASERERPIARVLRGALAAPMLFLPESI